MKKETHGKIVSVSAQRWIKINTKSVRVLGTDGAIYPHVIKASYTVNGKEYTKRKWISADVSVPFVGGTVRIVYDEKKPSRSKLM